MDRIETFKSFIARNPGDPFPRYGLAMEHKTRGELELARAAFQDVLEQFPDYIPTYLMAGGTLAALGQMDEAAVVFQRGIDIAGQRGDAHAKKELESALGDLDSKVPPIAAGGASSASLKPEERFR
ncbi:MAG: tetratricopeptide repeat protein [Kofleriaceae bacterium]